MVENHELASMVPVELADEMDTEDMELFEEVSLSATALVQGNCSNSTFDPAVEV